MLLKSELEILNTPEGLDEASARVTAPVAALRTDLAELDPAIKVSSEVMSDEERRTSIFITPKGTRNSDEKYEIEGGVDDSGNGSVVMDHYDREAVLACLKQGKAVILTEKTDPIKAFFEQLSALVAQVQESQPQLKGTDWVLEGQQYDGHEIGRWDENYHSYVDKVGGQRPVVHTQMTFGGNQVRLEMVSGSHEVAVERNGILAGFTPNQGVQVIGDFVLVRADENTITRETPTGETGIRYELMFVGA